MRSPDDRRRLSLPVILAIIALLLTTLYVIGLVLDWPGWLRGVNWIWVRRVPSPGWRFLLMPLALGAGLALGWIALKRGEFSRRKTNLFLLGLVILGPLLQIAVAAQHRAQPLSVVVLGASGFWLEGARIEDPLRFARDHAARMPEFSDVHLRTQPPGWPLAYQALTRLYARFPGLADTIGRRIHRFDCAAPQLAGLSTAQLAAGSLRIGLLFLSGLGAPLLYASGRRIYPPTTARVGALAYVFLPAMLVFSARFDVAFALIGLVAWWLALRALLDGRRAAAIFLAIGVAAASFLSFTVLIVAALALLLAAAVFLVERGRAAIRPILALGLWVATVVVIFWGGLRLVGIDGAAMFRAGQTMHQTFRLAYPLWPLFNLYDLAVFMGIVPFIGAIGAFFFSLVALRRGARSAAAALALGWSLAVVLLDLSGTVRAETARLWLFLMPVGALIGFSYFVNEFGDKAGNGADRAGRVSGGSGRDGARGEIWLMVMLAAFMVQSLVAGFYLGGRAGEAITPPPQWRLPKETTSLDYRLGESIALRGYTLEPEGERFRLTLFWQALDFPRADYSVFVHALDGEGSILTQSDGPPANVPVWCWIPDEVVADERLLVILPGTRAIAVGVYDPLIGIRLPVSPQSPDDRILLPWPGE